LLRFIAAGEVSIGHLSKDSTVIHRNVDETQAENVLSQPQTAMSEMEANTWRVLTGWQYEN